MSRKSVIAFLNHFELYIATVLFIIITFLLTIQILSRYLFGHPLTWTEEISLVLFIWMIYFAISAATLKRKHIRMDFILEKLPFKIKKATLIFSNLMAILFFGYFLGPFSDIVLNLYNMHSTTPITAFPKTVAYGVVPVAFILIIIRFCQDSVTLVKENEAHLGNTQASLDFDSK